MDKEFTVPCENNFYDIYKYDNKYFMSKDGKTLSEKTPSFRVQIGSELPIALSSIQYEINDILKNTINRTQSNIELMEQDLQDVKEIVFGNGLILDICYQEKNFFTREDLETNDL